jgi:hypothetical protein
LSAAVRLESGKLCLLKGKITCSAYSPGGHPPCQRVYKDLIPQMDSDDVFPPSTVALERHVILVFLFTCSLNRWVYLRSRSGE